MLRTLLFLVVCTAFASPVDAGISVMGFSGGDDTFTLSAILTQAINQVAVLKNIATFTSDALKDAQFIKDMYDTADDVASGRWQALSDEFVGDILGSDPTIAQIRDNTETLIAGAYPRGSGFRRIVGTGLAQGWFEVFGGYPAGRIGTQYAVGDYQSQNLERLADGLANSARKQREQERLSHVCNEGLADCQRLEGRMAVVQAQNLQHLVDLQSAQARANSAQLGIVTDEKKAAVLQQQKETADIGKAFDTVSGVRPPTQTWNVEDFAR